MKTLLCWGIPDIAKFIALRHRFDICYAVDRDAGKIEYLARLFAFDTKVHLSVFSGSLDEFCRENGVCEVDTLAIALNGRDANSTGVVAGILEKGQVRSVRCRVRMEDFGPLDFEDAGRAAEKFREISNVNYECISTLHEKNAANSDFIDLQWVMKKGDNGKRAETVQAARRGVEKAYRFNIIYTHLPEGDAFVARRGNVSVVASATPLADCDLYLYLNAYSYRGRQKGYDVLLLAEPIVVLPGQYNDDIWSRFDHIFTLYDTLVERDARFTKIPMFRSGGWADAEDAITENVSLRDKLYPLKGRRNAISMINGNKRSSMEGELYSKRIDAAMWFFHNSDIPFDVYGNPPFFLPNYRGTVAPGKRFSVLAQYKFSLCFENMNHPLFALGYVEKIFDCLETRTVPIYYGCPNIEKYVPRECFIDFREFDGFADLDRYLHSMTDDEYMRYIENIDMWVCGGGLRPYSWCALFDCLIHFCSSRKGIDVSLLAGEDEDWEKHFTPQESNQLLPVFWTFTDLASRPSKFLPTGLGLGTGSDLVDHIQRAIDFASGGKLREALDELAQVPFDGNGDKHYVCAQMMHLAGLPEAALVQLHTALSMNPNHSHAHNQLGVVYFERKEHGKAEASFRRAVQLDSSNHLARKNLAFFLLQTGRREEAMPMIKSVEPYFPEEVRSIGL